MPDKILQILSTFNQLLRDNAKRSAHSMVAVGLIGTVAHCFYGI